MKQTKGDAIADIMEEVANAVHHPLRRASMCLQLMTAARDRIESCAELTAEETASVFLDGAIVS